VVPVQPGQKKIRRPHFNEKAGYGGIGLSFQLQWGVNRRITDQPGQK
jgi:hypothetical protein